MGIATDLIKYLGILFIGAVIGYRDVISDKISDNLDMVQEICLLFLLFTMGITIGIDEEVVSNLFTIGAQALVMSIFTIIFSIIGVRLVKRFVIVKDDEDES